MAYYLGKTSLKNLNGVHPDLVRVIVRAIQITKYDFGVSEGERTLAKQKQEVAEGDSSTLDSLHLEQDDGFSHAVDIFGYVNGKADYSSKVMNKIAQAMFTAAIDEGVQLEWGGFWQKPKDKPHWQLNRKYYP